MTAVEGKDRLGETLFLLMVGSGSAGPSRAAPASRLRSHPPLPEGAPGPWRSQAPHQLRSRGAARTPSRPRAEAPGAAAGCVNGQARRVAPETLRCIHRQQKSEGVISYLHCLTLPNFKNKNPSCLAFEPTYLKILWLSAQFISALALGTQLCTRI